jgi:hypothetical protein
MLCDHPCCRLVYANLAKLNFLSAMAIIDTYMPTSRPRGLCFLAVTKPSFDQLDKISRPMTQSFAQSKPQTSHRWPVDRLRSSRDLPYARRVHAVSLKGPIPAILLQRTKVVRACPRVTLSLRNRAFEGVDRCRCGRRGSVLARGSRRA